MKHPICLLLFTFLLFACDNGKKVNKNQSSTDSQQIHHTDSVGTINTTTTTPTDTSVATDEVTDSTPPIGLKPLTDSIFVDDTTANAIIKALYYTTKGDTILSGVTVAADYPEELWMDIADTAYMQQMEHITYMQDNKPVYFCILSGHIGNAQDHDFYVYTYVFLHLTPKGWWVKTEEPGNEMDLEDHQLIYLKDGTLLFWRTTDCVIAGGDLWHHINIDMVGKDTVLPVYSKLDDWSNTASDCKDRSKGTGECDCYSNHIDLNITHRKGQPFFMAKENLTEDVFSKKTCETIGTKHTLNIKACMDNKCVLLSSKNLKTHKTTTYIKYDPKVIMDSLKVAKKEE